MHGALRVRRMQAVGGQSAESPDERQLTMRAMRVY